MRKTKTATTGTSEDVFYEIITSVFNHQGYLPEIQRVATIYRSRSLTLDDDRVTITTSVRKINGDEKKLETSLRVSLRRGIEESEILTHTCTADEISNEMKCFTDIYLDKIDKICQRRPEIMRKLLDALSRYLRDKFNVDVKFVSLNERLFMVIDDREIHISSFSFRRRWRGEQVNLVSREETTDHYKINHKIVVHNVETYYYPVEMDRELEQILRKFISLVREFMTVKKEAERHDVYPREFDDKLDYISSLYVRIDVGRGEEIRGVEKYNVILKGERDARKVREVYERAVSMLEDMIRDLKERILDVRLFGELLFS
jgi:hypothetical protein